MQAALDNRPWTLHGIKGAQREVQASTVLDAIAQACWECGDPGVQFIDTINDNRTVFEKINASNPCAEFVFVDDSACNLASLNLVKYLTASGKFDTEQFESDIFLLVKCMDQLVDIGGYPTAKIAENSYKYRPLGLGYCNLGALLMRKGIAYDSDVGRDAAQKITALMHVTALRASTALGTNPFVTLDTEKLQHHCMQLFDDPCNYSWLDVSVVSDMSDISSSPKNAQVTVLAPTGTIGLLMDCDTTGVEPMYSLVSSKKLAGGGTIKLANKSVTAGLHSLGYSYSDVTAANELIKTKGTLNGFPFRNSSDAAVFHGASEISPKGHIYMMAAVQPFLSGAISKTVNVPNETTPQQIRELITTAWNLNLKSVAIYRDGCKASQPLNSAKKEEKKEIVTKEKTKENRMEMPKKRRGTTYSASVGGQKIYLRTGETANGELGEVFIDMNKEGATMRSLMNCFAIAVSLGLRHGVPLQTFVDKFTFTRFEPNGVVTGHPNIRMATSLIDYIFRCLGYDYLYDASLVQVPDESWEHDEMKEPPKKETGYDSDAPLCHQCGSITVRNGACHRCLNCGTSLGCS